MQNYYEDSGKGYTVDVEYPKELQKAHNELPFLPKRIKIEKCEKLVCNLCDYKNYFIHTTALKQALDHGLILKKVCRVIKFNEEAWLKPYIDMNMDLRAKAKNDFEKDFFKLMNNSVFGKPMENVRKHKDIRHGRTNRRSSHLVSEPNYHTSKWFSENLLVKK